MIDPNSPYLPQPATVLEILDETPDIRTLRLRLSLPGAQEAFRFQPGQVAQLSLYGVGESTFVINSSPTRLEYLQFSILRAGEVTERLHRLQPGDSIGLRGPLGNWFPYEAMRGKNVLLVAGGIGMAPLRTLLLFLLDHRADYGEITLLYGARSPEHLCYQADLGHWQEQQALRLYLTADREGPGWTHHVGRVPDVLRDMAPSPENTVAVTCGPPIMIRFTLETLLTLGFPEEAILTTLERRMKCGVGLCGRCNIGPTFVCVDGPVFSYAQLKKLPQEF